MEFEKQNIIVTDWETEKVTRVQRIKEQKQGLKMFINSWKLQKFYASKSLAINWSIWVKKGARESSKG